MKSRIAFLLALSLLLAACAPREKTPLVVFCAGSLIQPAADLEADSAFDLLVTDRTPAGVVVAEGVPWLTHVHGGRTVNALTSQRLTDEGAGSTFYDNRVDVRPEA